MKKLLWKFFISFFNFQHILCLNASKKGKLKINYWIFLWNLIMPFSAFGVIMFVSKDIAKFMDPNVANMQNISLLFVRVMKVYPVLTNFGMLLVLLMTKNTKKVLKLAKRLLKLTKILELNSDATLFKSLEMQCFTLWMLSQPLLIIGFLFNIISVIKMHFESFVMMALLTWTLSSASHIILVCIFTMKFFETLVRKLTQDVIEGDDSLGTSFDRLRCIVESFEDYRLVSDVVMSIAFTKLLVESLVLVILKGFMVMKFKLLIDFCTILQWILVFIIYYNDFEYIGFVRLMSNVSITISHLILVCSLVQPAMEIQKSSKKIILHLTNDATPRKRDILLMNLPSLVMHKQMAVFRSFSFNNQFLFLVITTCLSFLIVLLQFEIESTKVFEFNVFSME